MDTSQPFYLGEVERTPHHTVFPVGRDVAICEAEYNIKQNLETNLAPNLLSLGFVGIWQLTSKFRNLCRRVTLETYRLCPYLSNWIILRRNSSKMLPQTTLNYLPSKFPSNSEKQSLLTFKTLPAIPQKSTWAF